jgi:NAD(P)-dependent dehydrogenase (short-subunit alcohol dehydrogenase family)
MSSGIALVTGGNRGIGFEICHQLSQKGWQVFLASRDLERGTEAALKLDKSGKQVRAIQLDVASEQSIKRAAGELAGHVKHLDVLVNNAAIYEDGSTSILNVSPELMMTTFQTNTLGPLLVTQRLYPLLAKSKSGRVINISSGAGQLNEMEDETPSYSISKTALNAVTRQMASALKPHNLAVNSVCPGWVRTDMGGPNATRSPAEGADTVVWLATEAPAEITGQFLRDRASISW